MEQSRKKQIVNIVNFVRGCEPRLPIDLTEAVLRQIELMKKLGLKGTFLLQYDALIDPVFVDIFKALDDSQFEFGVWQEVVEPQCQSCGIPWHGRWPWDWHVHCGFPHGYTEHQRKQLADALFEKFKEVFGYYPRVFGSWLLDTHTVNYVNQTYGVDAFCDCKEQYGTDGYTLWGGYYAQGYYPSTNNVFFPAQTQQAQVNAPLFRMLGSDQVYQFDRGMNIDDDTTQVQTVITLEPVYTGEGGGGEPKWVDWYLKENFNGECLSFGYTQAGQENSFGWPRMADGLTYQFERFAQLQKEGKLTVEPLGETGRWFKQTYALTPSSTVTAHTTWDERDKKSVWFNSRKYRINLFSDENGVRIRDLHIFDESVRDPYNETVCEKNEAIYETLPVADGNRFSGNGILSGIFLIEKGQTLHGDYTFRETDSGVQIRFGDYTFYLNETGFSVENSTGGEFVLENRVGSRICYPEILSTEAQKQTLRNAIGQTKYSYDLCLREGKFLQAETVTSENGRISVYFP